MDQAVSQLVSGGMGAAASIAVIQICSREQMSGSLQGAVTTFAFTIPLLIYLWIDPFFNKDLTWALKAHFDMVLFVLANGATGCGFALLFYHFGTLAGTAFLGLFVCLAVYIAWLRISHP